MKKVTRPLNYLLKKRLQYNPGKLLYEIKENSAVYAMPLELTRSLNNYSYKIGNEHELASMVSSWYNTLSKAEKKLVTRTGHNQNDVHDFYPD